MLILASQSPRRQEILSRAGIRFISRPAEISEERMGDENPREHVGRLARLKAEAVAAAPEDVVLGADTVVVIEGRILGKPADPAQAAWMLRLLSGREHEVITGFCLRAGGRSIVEVESTRVRFVPLSEREIADYVASGEPMDKAGAYAIQGLASRFVDRIEGCYCNVVGLPVALVWRHLQELAAFPAKEAGKL